MSVHRRVLGRGRLLAAGAAVVVLIGCLLPWFRVGDPDVLTPTSGNAFSGTGILVVLAALATIALVTLPYAAGDHPVAIERWWAYGMLAGLAALALLIRVAGIVGDAGSLEAILPDRGPGLWLSAAGVLGLGIATSELFGSRGH
jgi:hypothetical protein